MRHEQALVALGIQELKRLEGVTVYAADDMAGQAGVLSFTVDGMDCEEVGAGLGQAGIAVRAGYHCAPFAHRSAGTLDTGTVRVSVSAFNKPWELHRLGEAVERLQRRKA